MALKSTECQADPTRSSQYTFVPAEYDRTKHDLDISACVCKSRHCHRHVGLLPDAGKPGRTRAAAKRSRDADSPTSAMDGLQRSSSAGVRSKPSVVTTIYKINSVRQTAIDCDQASSDEAVLEAHRSPLPEGALPEFEIHGKFKMTADGRDGIRWGRGRGGVGRRGRRSRAEHTLRETLDIHGYPGMDTQAWIMFAGMYVYRLSGLKVGKIPFLIV